MSRYDFGPWTCKTTFNKEDNTRTYEINYRYNNLTFFINSSPKSELNWNEICEQLKRREENFIHS